MTMLFSGLVGGGIQGSAGMGGPPLVTTLLSLGDDAKTTRANIIIVLNAMSLTNAIMIAIYGKLTPSLVQFSIIASVFYVVATMFGAKFFRQNGNEHFRKAALGILALIALLMIYSIF